MNFEDLEGCKGNKRSYFPNLRLSTKLELLLKIQYNEGQLIGGEKKVVSHSSL